MFEFALVEVEGMLPSLRVMRATGLELQTVDEDYAHFLRLFTKHSFRTPAMMMFNSPRSMGYDSDVHELQQQALEVGRRAWSER